MQERMQHVAQSTGERVLKSPNNPISIAMTVDTLASTCDAHGGERSDPRSSAVAEEAQPLKTANPGDASAAERRRVTRLGAMLWQRRVSGVRVIARGVQQQVAGLEFQGYGSSCDAYGSHYVTAAAAIGGTTAEADVFCAKLQRCMAQCAAQGAAKVDVAALRLG